MITVPTLADLNLGITLPALFLSGFILVLLIVDLFIPKDRKIITAQLTVAGLAVAFLLNLAIYNTNETALFGMFVADPFSAFFNMIILVTGVITVLFSIDYLKRARIEQTEYYVMLLFSVLGMMLMASANNLIVIFIALELLSIPLYVMAAMRGDAKSQESGMKYFILGAFASAFFLYGAALIYGATGTVALPEIFAAVEGIVAELGAELFYLVVGVALIVAGLAFKVAAVPFHMWTPDVYEGAPTPVTAFMSVGAKAGGFAALLRIGVVALPAFVFNDVDTAAAWQTSVAVIAALTMILGNIVAISQTNIKRMLAYSSIAHAGYLLVAVAAAAADGVANSATQAALVYLMAYAFTNLGAFAVALAIERSDGTGTDLDDFVGLSRSRPLLAIMMAVFMFSLTGVPLTAGFTGKWLVFGSAMQAGLVWLAVIGVLTSVVSAFYYVRVIVNMYLRDGEGDAAAGATHYVNLAVYVSFAGTLLLGIFPALVTNLVDTVALALTTPLF
jgi:NADH-quinone oxidoreductase subunit N